jgi:hypothetical protein
VEDIDVQMVFIGFKQAFDSVNRNQMYKVLAERGMPKKLVNLIRVTLTDITDIRGKIIFEDIHWKNSPYIKG